MIIPAILTNDLEEAQAKLDIISTCASWAQIDIMDGSFVEHTSIGIADMSLLKTDLFVEAHLMVNSPEYYFQDCESVGFARVIVHYEALSDCRSVADEMKTYNFERGVAINPETRLEEIEPFVEDFDLLLIMGVHPGRSGQEFIPEMLEKIKNAREMFPFVSISVDGGVDEHNIKQIAEYGADMVVSGSGLFQDDDILGEYMKLTQLFDQGAQRRVG